MYIILRPDHDVLLILRVNCMFIFSLFTLRSMVHFLLLQNCDSQCKMTKVLVSEKLVEKMNPIPLPLELIHSIILWFTLLLFHILKFFLFYMLSFFSSFSFYLISFVLTYTICSYQHVIIIFHPLHLDLFSLSLHIVQNRLYALLLHGNQ